jgi:hypothetical protein
LSVRGGLRRLWSRLLPRRIDVWKPAEGDLVADGVLTAASLSAKRNDGRATLTLFSGESVEIELSDISDQVAVFTVLDPVCPKLI